MNVKAEPETKQCRRCGKIKPVGEFYHTNRKGKRYVCKVCAKRIASGEHVPYYETRRCEYCGANIDRLHYRRTCCDAPECKEKFRQDQAIRTAETKARYVKKTKSEKPKQRRCRACGHVIMNGNWWLCQECHGRKTRDLEYVRTDGDFLFA